VWGDEAMADNLNLKLDQNLDLNLGAMAQAAEIIGVIARTEAYTGMKCPSRP
jgi:hypothetical protein